MSDTPTDLIYSDMPGALPATYQLPDGYALTVQSIVARVDGSAAAGSFLPTLSILSPDGKLIARVPSDVTYAIGDTGVVTWSPFLARRVSTTPPSSTKIQWARFERDSTTNVNVPSGVNTQVIGNGHTISDATVFQVNSQREIQVLKAGLYSLTAHSMWLTYDATPRTIAVFLNALDPVITGGLSTAFYDPAIACGDVILAVNDKLTMSVHQASGGAQTLYGGGTGLQANYLEARYLGAVGP